MCAVCSSCSFICIFVSLGWHHFSFFFFWLCECLEGWYYYIVCVLLILFCVHNSNNIMKLCHQCMYGCFFCYSNLKSHYFKGVLSS